MMTPELADLLKGVNGLPCSYSRRMMIRVLQNMAGARVYLPRRELVAPDEVGLAVALLETMSRNEAAEALMVRLQCQRTKAYRLIRGALDARRAPSGPAAGLAGLRGQLALDLEAADAH